MRERTITPQQAERFYDRQGSKLDRYARFEERAKVVLAERGGFESARAVLEFGCGTGWLAERLLGRHLPADARYLGLDVSGTMVETTRRRLAPFGGRAEVRKSDGGMRLPVADGSFDRFVASYVFDLLSREDARELLGEAHRALGPGGKLCVVALTRGERLVSRAISALWGRIQRLAPAQVGGCRPIRTLELLSDDRWRLEHREVVTMFGVPAEVVVAEPFGEGPR